MNEEWNLSGYDNPQLYDIENKKTYELPFLMKWAEKLDVKNQTILDLACGTGRITIPFAEAGYHLLGVDIHEGMLARAKEKTEPNVTLSWINQNCLHLDPNIRSPFAYMVRWAFQLFLTNDHQNKLLQSVHNVLMEDGIFIFDTTSPLMQNVSQSRSRELFRVMKDEKSRKYHIYYGMNHEPDTQVIHYQITREFYDDNEVVEEIISTEVMRHTPIEELEETLSTNGFKVLHIYDGWREKALHSESHKRVFVCQKKSMS